MLSEMLKSKLKYFTKAEITLWCSSIVLIAVSFFAFDRENYLTLAASLIGVTSLIFNAKGNPFGQFLMVVFSVMYGIISFTFAYYGEMATYLGMTAPMAVFCPDFLDEASLPGKQGGSKNQSPENQRNCFYVHFGSNCYCSFLLCFEGVSYS